MARPKGRPVLLPGVLTAPSSSGDQAAAVRQGQEALSGVRCVTSNGTLPPPRLPGPPGP